MLVLDFRETLLGMLKHRGNLRSGDTGKPFQELISRRAGFQIFEKGPDRYAGSAKNPRPADLVVRALDFLAIGPIQHADP